MYSNALPPIKPFYDLPESVCVNGRDYAIRCQFDAAFAFMDYVDRNADADDETFINTVLGIWYPVVPEDKSAALAEALRFYCGGTLPGEGFYYTPVFAPADYKKNIYFDFIRHYGIDLNKTPLHWWTFRELMSQLPKRRRR